MTPTEIYEEIMGRAVTWAKAALVNAGQSWPDDPAEAAFAEAAIGIGVAAATEYYAKNPELFKGGG